MKQKIIKVGNSAAVTISKRFLEEAKMKIGDSLIMEGDTQLGMLIFKPEHAKYETKITPQFKAWLDEFMEENRELLQKLAKRP